MFEVFTQEVPVVNGVLPVFGNSFLVNCGNAGVGLETAFNGDSFAHFLAQFGEAASHAVGKARDTAPADTGWTISASPDDGPMPPPPR